MRIIRPSGPLGKSILILSDKPLFILDLIATILSNSSEENLSFLLINSIANLKSSKSALFWVFKGSGKK
jgi:hypothetical protein